MIEVRSIEDCITEERVANKVIEEVFRAIKYELPEDKQTLGAVDSILKKAREKLWDLKVRL